MIAVAGVAPMILAGLYGGMLADTFDRRRVTLIVATLTFGSTALARSPHLDRLRDHLMALRTEYIVNSAANSAGIATRTATVPRHIPRDMLAAASALNSVAFGLTVITGPALARLLLALTGYGWTYTIDVFLLLSVFLGLWTLPAL